jgi:hypothetical protein
MGEEQRKVFLAHLRMAGRLPRLEGAELQPGAKPLLRF